MRAGLAPAGECTDPGGRPECVHATGSRYGFASTGRIGRLDPRALRGPLGLVGLLVVAGSAARVEPKSIPNRAVPELQPIASYALTVPEPSDLAIDESGTLLWTVSDKLGKVLQLGLDGRVLRTLDFVGEDLEGIAYDPADRTLWVAEENRRELIHLDADGRVLSRRSLALRGEKNSGLEGVCLDERGRLIALNEKKPGLFLELDESLAISTRRELTFAEDYSGIAHDRSPGRFWIVSDQSQALYLWSSTAGVLKQYRLPFRKAEGVAVDFAAKRIYIVSDSENRLYVYRLDP